MFVSAKVIDLPFFNGLWPVTYGHMGILAYDHMGIWAYAMGLWAYGPMGRWAYGWVKTKERIPCQPTVPAYWLQKAVKLYITYSGQNRLNTAGKRILPDDPVRSCVRACVHESLYACVHVCVHMCVRPCIYACV